MPWRDGDPIVNNWRNTRPAVERLFKLAMHLAGGGSVTLVYIQTEYAISLSQAKRDMTFLESLLPLERTPMEPCPHGGRRCVALRVMSGARIKVVPLLRATAT